MCWIQRTAAAVAVVSLTLAASAASAQWEFEGKFGCVGRPAGSDNVVKVICYVERQRGNRIYESTLTFTIQGPVARHYVGKHDECWRIGAADTQQNQDIVTCAGIPEWW